MTIPPLIGVWGCMHGSYLLGFGLTGLLFLGDWIDSLRGLNAGKKKFVIQYSAVIAVSFALISAWNPLTSQFFSIQAIKNFISYDAGIESSKPIAQTWEGSGQACKGAFESPSEGRNRAGAVSADKHERRRRPSTGIRGISPENQSRSEQHDFQAGQLPFEIRGFYIPFDRLDRLYVKTGLLLESPDSFYCSFSPGPFVFPMCSLLPPFYFSASATSG